MKQPLVSVIVLTYKNFEHIEETIKSVYDQEYHNIEIILNDDCSDNFDEAKINEILSKYKKKFINCVVNRNKKNMGTVQNFNEAIKLSHGEVIAPLAADDLLDNSKAIKKIVDFFDNNNELVCTAKRRVIDINQKEIEVLPKKNQIDIIKGSNEKFLNELCKGNFISGACTYYKREVFNKFGLFKTDYRLVEDYPFYLTLALNNEAIGFLNYITIKYSIGGVSDECSLSPLVVNDYRKIYENIIFKNRHRLKYFTYRITKLNYYRQYCKVSKGKQLFIHLKYIDIVCIKSIRKIFKIKE